ncbi:TetR/AcrR family transcriptional regulator, partial [bacterium]|nr:TetR/AcrR family transcriptional regulator [bacterium]
MSPRPKGRTSKSELRGKIIEAAWDQITREGAAALSLRAVARDLGIAAPSIYNYFADRDGLVTALILEAYDSLARFQIAADDAAPVADLNARLVSIGRAYREWAVTYPQRYLLIFGTPIPGYVAPLDIIAPVAAKSLSVLVRLIENYRLAGRIKGVDLDDQAITILIWMRVHGFVSVEITNNL